MYIHNCVFRCRFIITITSNEPWNTQTHKTDRNPPITNHKPWPFEPVKVKFCFLRGPLRWLTAAKNAIVSWLLNFRIRMFVKSAVIDEPRARSIQPKFQLVRPGKVVHLKRWTRFFETFPVGPNRSFEFWTEISGNFGWMDRALRYTRKFPKSLSTLKQENLLVDLVSNSAMSSQQFSYRTRVRNLKFPPWSSCLFPGIKVKK